MTSDKRPIVDFRLKPAGNTGKWFLVNHNDDVVAEFPATTSEDERQHICNGANFHNLLVNQVIDGCRYIQSSADDQMQSPSLQRRARMDLALTQRIIKEVQEAKP